MILEPQPLYIIAASASRLAYRIGLHRKLDEFGLSEVEINQRRNVFWVVYVMDKSVALRLGHPSIMIDDNIEVDLLQEKNPVEKDPDGSNRYNIFCFQIQLAMIESLVYTELYSVRSQSRSALERLRSVGQLDKALLHWQEGLPVEIQTDKDIQCTQEQLLPIIMMHFDYFNCLTTIHRVSVHHGSWTSSQLSQSKPNLHVQELNPRVYGSRSICLMAARRSIKLLPLVNFKANSILNNLIRFVPSPH
jgi:hypothetical protein